MNCEPVNLSYLYFTLYPATGQALTSMITDTYYQRCRLYPFFQAVSSTSHYCPVLAALSGEQDSLFRSRFLILLRHYDLPLYTHLPIFIKPFRMLTSTTPKCRTTRHFGVRGASSHVKQFQRLLRIGLSDKNSILDYFCQSMQNV